MFIQKKIDDGNFSDSAWPAVWPDLTNDSYEDESKLSLRLSAICENYKKYKSKPILESAFLRSMQNDYAKTVFYAYHYFGTDNIKPADLWPKLCRLDKERQDCKPIMLLVDFNTNNSSQCIDYWREDY